MRYAKYFLLLLITNITNPHALLSKDLPINLVGNKLVLEQQVDKSLDLIDISKVNKNIILDIRYATRNNITGKKLYSSDKCYFRKKVAVAISNIQKELETRGLGLKIWDGFRPMAVQKCGYQMFPTLFAKPNEERAHHPRGNAVDLTLVDKYGNELLMPTEFDDMTVKARRTSRAGIPKEACENREVLEMIMAKHGFIANPYEWWHFDYYTWKADAIIYLDFDEIEKELNKGKPKPPWLERRSTDDE